MILRSLASAFPSHVFRQSDCLEIARSHPQVAELPDRSRQLFLKILGSEHGIETRHFAEPDPERLFSRSAEDLNHDFERQAPQVAGEALTRALDQAGILPKDIDALLVATCTGYLCPGVTSHLAEQLGLRTDAYLQDLVGLGCGAAIPLLRAARGLLAAEPDAVVATVAVEICSAAFYLDPDPGVLISLCLFGDGASASIWAGEGPEESWRAAGFTTLHRPEHRESIRFVNAGGKLRNKLHRNVPEVAAASVSDLYAQRSRDPEQVIAHTGGRDVLDEIEKVLPVSATDGLSESRAVLRQYGNCSSPCVLLALENRLASVADDQHLWLTSFGAGFAAHAMELVRS